MTEFGKPFRDLLTTPAGVTPDTKPEQLTGFELFLSKRAPHLVGFMDKLLSDKPPAIPKPKEKAEEKGKEKGKEKEKGKGVAKAKQK
jgi:hypothetical protein